MDHKFRKQFPNRKLIDIISTTRTWKIQHNAAIVIQRAWRAYRARRYPPMERPKSTVTLGSRASALIPKDGMFNKMGHLLHGMRGAEHKRKTKKGLEPEPKNDEKSTKKLFK